MTAEEYLEQIKMIDAIVKSKWQDYQYWVEIANGLGGFSVEERVQTTKNPQRGTDAILKYIGIEDEIKKLLMRRQDIINTIQQLPYNEYRVLYVLFVETKKNGDDYMLKELPSMFHKSYDWCKKKKRRGLDLVQNILDRE